MKTPFTSTRSFLTVLLLVTVLLAVPANTFAHCDTMNGPVVLDARKALETGVLDPVLKWVTSADEAEVKAAFDRTMKVRTINDEVREMADLYFFETVVRLHRMSEGVGYTGLKPAAAVAPAIAAADRALETGSVDALSNMLTRDLRDALAERFAEAYAARAHADHSVEAGRAFVETYVRFTHLAEEIDAITKHASGAHAAGHGTEAPVHTH